MWQADLSWKLYYLGTGYIEIIKTEAMEQYNNYAEELTTFCKQTEFQGIIQILLINQSVKTMSNDDIFWYKSWKIRPHTKMWFLSNIGWDFTNRVG